MNPTPNTDTAGIQRQNIFGLPSFGAPSDGDETDYQQVLNDLSGVYGSAKNAINVLRGDNKPTNSAPKAPGSAANPAPAGFSLDFKNPVVLAGIGAVVLVIGWLALRKR